MKNVILGQILAGVLGRAMSRRSGGLGGGLGGRMGGGAMAGRGNVLIGLLLPLAMQWVQRNGGLREVLKRFQQKGMSRQAQSWVATGENLDLHEPEVEDVVGRDEISRMAREAGVPEREVAQAFAQILPEMVNQLTPEGQVPDDADDVLAAGREELQKELREAEGAVR